jgi:hypothetical protein
MLHINAVAVGLLYFAFLQLARDFLFQIPRSTGKTYAPEILYGSANVNDIVCDVARGEATGSFVSGSRLKQKVGETHISYHMLELWERTRNQS